jgi:hypothetical protein
MTQTVQHINPVEIGNPSHYGFTNIVVVPAAITFIAKLGWIKTWNFNITL